MLLLQGDVGPACWAPEMLLDHRVENDVVRHMGVSTPINGGKRLPKLSLIGLGKAATVGAIGVQQRTVNIKDNKRFFHNNGLKSSTISRYKAYKYPTKASKPVWDRKNDPIP